MANNIHLWFTRQRMAHKLTAVVLMVSGVTLAVACAVLLIYDYSASRLRLVREVTALADVVGSNGALAFGDTKAAEETLRSASVDGHVVSARLFTRDGTQLAAYTNDQKPARAFTFDNSLLRSPEPASRFAGMHLHVLRPIMLGGEVVGSIAVESDTRDIRSRLAGFGIAVAVVLFATIWLAFWLSRVTARITCGPIEYMSKPINPKVLFSLIEQPSSQGHPAGDAAAQAPMAKTFDRQALLDRVAGDEQLMDDVIRVFLEDCAQQLTAIRGAVDQKNPDAIRTAAHALKGAAGNLSADGLFEAAGLLERIGAESRMDVAEAAWRRLSAEAATVIDALRREISDNSEESLCVR